MDYRWKIDKGAEAVIEKIKVKIETPYFFLCKSKKDGRIKFDLLHKHDRYATIAFVLWIFVFMRIMLYERPYLTGEIIETEGKCEIIAKQKSFSVINIVAIFVSLFLIISSGLLMTIQLWAAVFMGLIGGINLFGYIISYYDSKREANCLDIMDAAIKMIQET